MEYDILEEIGRGSYGSVFKAKHQTTGRVYAVKRLNVTKCTHYEKNCILNEIRVLSTHDCPFIVAFKSAYFLNHHVHIVTEFATNGDLAKAIQRHKQASTRLEENQIWNYFLQLAIAVDYLHQIHVIHRDLKPANVFLDNVFNVKLGDVGVAKIMRSYMMYGQTQVGTPLYMSPEVLKRERYDAKTDVWSLGCVLYELMNLTPAFVCRNLHDLRSHVCAGKLSITNCQRFYTGALTSLVPRMISVRHRADMKSILRCNAVRKQLEIRVLTPMMRNDAKAHFNMQCQVPRMLFDWHQVVRQFCDSSNTVRMNDRDQTRMNAVTKNNTALHTHFPPLSMPRVLPNHAVGDEIRRFEGLLAEATRYTEAIRARLDELRKENMPVVHA